jgi:hypothetical protein
MHEPVVSSQGRHTVGGSHLSSHTSAHQIKSILEN